ncbi:double-strand break repair protein AddB [Actibacterium pelagium]|uniref:Double-strand break repair protein AddB n=1 Tax=Actibacterium pelagium TaxID=2029103 RepID=A0A917AIG3_9RHOB|nr:double-strand break repair protein AddB [Actibacterium pelagium]GGE55639.1 double-strand break repair protein AddB [Actibacterium pelagium]
MFKESGPRVFGVAPGVDFPKALIAGLEERLTSTPPQDWARVEVFVNTRRMARRLTDLLAEGPARILPRIRLITDLATDPTLTDLPKAVSPLQRRLELTQLVADLIERQPDLAPRAAAFDLADSLADLMDEMQGEGVDPAALHALDVSHLSAHWARSLAFINIIERYFGPQAMTAPDKEARQRQVVSALIERWKIAPPDHPILIAGSTGSRGTTALLMQAVAQLPQGALVLPGFDFDQPAPVWANLSKPPEKRSLAAEDHPQFRFAKLLRDLDLTHQDVPRWETTEAIPNPTRNKLISLSLRPAPVTDQWMVEGAELTDLPKACAEITLLEADSPRMEAGAIALRLRKAAEDGQKAALITPDRGLARMVGAALDRWKIEPDDSAGTPLQQTAPGRFLRHVAALFGERLTTLMLLTLLKHPLCHAEEGRNQHMLWTRELELYLRRKGCAFPDGDILRLWASTHQKDDGRQAWADWLAGKLDGLEQIGSRDLSDHIAQHRQLTEALSAGPGGQCTKLWSKNEGEKTRQAVEDLAEQAAYGGAMSPRDYADLFRAVLARDEARDPVAPHPDIMIWGTLEARVQGADLVILGGLNEGSWPSGTSPDPWLNREMRQTLGLLLPERQIGLSAHDYQQAVTAPQVVLSRAIRDAEAQTVPSRWLNRLVNLLGGLPDQGGRDALDQMKARGTQWLDWAALVDRPEHKVDPAPRPAPRPPETARPSSLSVTRIQTLIRDPYAIYARYILGLKPLDPLHPQPDAALRGTILHKVMEEFLKQNPDPSDPDAIHRLLDTADQVFAEHAPWPANRRIWRARLARVAEGFMADEVARQTLGHWIALERGGRLNLPSGFTLTAEADRIDQTDEGRLVIYDYKTGKPPSAKQVETYDKQLLLEAIMAEAGAFHDLGAGPVDHAAYIGLGASAGEQRVETPADLLTQTRDDLIKLIAAYAQPDQGYLARRSLEKREDVTDYDHLSRYGEWNEGDAAPEQEVGK